MFYTIRKNKAKNGNIVTFKNSFYDLIKDADGWVIRVFISTLLKKIGEYKGNLSINFECDNKINDIINKNGETKFPDPIIHKICYCFIDGMERSTEKDVSIIYQSIKTFFEKIEN